MSIERDEDVLQCESPELSQKPHGGGAGGAGRDEGT